MFCFVKIDPIGLHFTLYDQFNIFLDTSEPNISYVTLTPWDENNNNKLISELHDNWAHRKEKKTYEFNMSVSIHVCLLNYKPTVGSLFWGTTCYCWHFKNPLNLDKFKQVK